MLLNFQDLKALLKYQADVFQEECILSLNTQWMTLFIFRLRKPMDEEFLRDFKIFDRKQNDMQATKPVLVKSVLKTACLRAASASCLPCK